MAELLRPTSDVSASNLAYSTGTTAYSLVDESVLDTADWISQVGNSGPSDVIMHITDPTSTPTSATAYANVGVLRQNDTGTLTAQLVNSAGTGVSDAVQIATQASSGEVSASLTNLNVSSWSDVRLKLTWAYTRVGGADSPAFQIRVYQTWVEVEAAATYTASAAGTSGSTTGAATATHTAPTYTASAAGTTGSATGAATAAFTASTATFTASTAGTTGSTTGSASATHTAPTYTAAVAATTGTVTGAATAAFATAMYQAQASGTTGTVTGSASATHTAPTFTASVAGAIDPISATSSATFAEFVTFTSSVSITLDIVTASVSAGFANYALDVDSKRQWQIEPENRTLTLAYEDRTTTVHRPKPCS